jgi:signal transduction histidine kinase
LFEAFFRAQQPGTEDIKGTGLGLNLVKVIVEKHDGQVFFSSQPGKGSTFGFWIPSV